MNNENIETNNVEGEEEKKEESSEATPEPEKEGVATE